MRLRDRPTLPSLSQLAPFLWIGVICLVVEIALSASDLLGGTLRMQILGYLAFWPTLLGQSYLQTTTMFLTYWLVHSGPMHLIGNLAVLGWLALRLGPHLSRGTLWNVWAASVLGGAMAYAVLPRQDLSPMVGASGGVFGLIGALLIVRFRATRRADPDATAMRDLLLAFAGLIALSAIDFVMRGSILAWQAHLGGLLIGALLTIIEPQIWR